MTVLGPTWVDEHAAYDLAWVERQIERTENIEPVNEDMATRRLEYLERLRRVRARLLGEVA